MTGSSSSEAIGHVQSSSTLVVQHLEHEGSGLVGSLLAERGSTIRTVRAWRGEPVPRTVPNDIDALVVLGGDMGWHQADEHPHLRDEVALLSDAVSRGVRTLGLCLGAQLLAVATGGSVTPSMPEFGYLPLEVLDPTDQVGALLVGARVLSLHSDDLSVGPGAVVLARTPRCVHAFRTGSGLGLQFHPEFDHAALTSVCAGPGFEDYLRGGGWSTAALLADAEGREPAVAAHGNALLAAWLA